MVEKVALEQVSKFFSFAKLIIIPSLPHTHPLPPHVVCHNPNQEAHFHALSPKLGAYL
jgi:hypothetical protein